jgi:hypothetical protein
MLYLIYAESANYCGYGMHFVVNAEDQSEAEMLAENDINDYFYEQDDEDCQEDGIFDGPYGSIIRIEEFGPEHDSWKFYQDPSQSEFYWKVN